MAEVHEVALRVLSLPGGVCRDDECGGDTLTVIHSSAFLKSFIVKYSNENWVSQNKQSRRFICYLLYNVLIEGLSYCSMWCVLLSTWDWPLYWLIDWLVRATRSSSIPNHVGSQLGMPGATEESLLCTSYSDFICFDKILFCRPSSKNPPPPSAPLIILIRKREKICRPYFSLRRSNHKLGRGRRVRERERGEGQMTRVNHSQGTKSLG